MAQGKSLDHNTFRVCGGQPNFIKSFLQQLPVCTVKAFIQQVSMEYLFVPVHVIFLSVRKRRKTAKYSAPSTLNFKIPWTLRFDYLAQVVGWIRDNLVR